MIAFTASFIVLLVLAGVIARPSPSRSIADGDTPTFPTAFPTIVRRGSSLQSALGCFTYTALPGPITNLPAPSVAQTDGCAVKRSPIQTSCDVNSCINTLRAQAVGKSHPPLKCGKTSAAFPRCKFLKEKQGGSYEETNAEPESRYGEFWVLGAG
ncbi:hypothetical protein C8J56DRAFT_1038908 [Mycena floridula]|nr:hypothetical protein C8J56DRAFT_1038908 [Mycena floridula]